MSSKLTIHENVVWFSSVTIVNSIPFWSGWLSQQGKQSPSVSLATSSRSSTRGFPARHPNHLKWLPSMWRGCSLAPGSASVTHWGCQKNYRETSAKIGFMFSFLFCRHSWEVRLAKNHFPENKKTIYGVRGQTNLQRLCICCVVHAVIQQHDSPHTSIYTVAALWEVKFVRNKVKGTSKSL